MRSNHLLAAISILLCAVLLTACPLLKQQSPQKGKPEKPKLVSEKEPAKEVVSPEVGDGNEKDHRELSMENIVEIYGDTIFRFGDRNTRTIALTFDDGPDREYTLPILDILRQYGVKATFFITGVRANENRDILRQIYNEGHEIALHGYHHYKMSNLTPEKILEELELLNQLIRTETGQISRVFRPPYGAIDAKLVETIKGEGFFIVLWDIDSLDWRGLSADQVAQNILPYIHPGAVILQHAAGGPGEDLTGTVQALPQVITALQQGGYTFQTISEMFAEKMVMSDRGELHAPPQSTGGSNTQ